jgi:hypothetical protein
MKKLIITVLFLIPLFTFSQQLRYGAGGTVYDANKKLLKPKEVRAILAKDSTLYNVGRTKKTVGNVFFYGGLGLLATNFIVAGTTDNTSLSSYNPNNPYSSPTIKSNRADFTAGIIGGLFLVASIPIKIGYPKKIKSALNSYNKPLTENYNPNQKLTLIASNNQIGFRFEF